MTSTPRTVCVYCGSSPGNSMHYQEEARLIGRCLAERDLSLVYGGGKIGLMGAVAEGALAYGGTVIGVIPQALKDRELAHPKLTRLITVNDMHERKMTMVNLADAFLALPGGIGTLEELFEVFTWLQLDLHCKPIGLLNSKGYYDHLLKFLDQMVTCGFIHRDQIELLKIDSDPTRLVDRIFPVNI